jgi:deazaflavin-dependent oxidoreductase (nitroreductase family)
MPTPTADTPHYRAPGWFTRNVFNRSIAGLTRLGISVMGSRVLETTGRTSGLPRRTPVNLLKLDGKEYLVSPRGHGQWVRNVRAADGRLTLLLGRRRQEYVGRELPPDDPSTATILRAYLRKWKAEVGVFFEGVGPDSTDAELTAVAGKHPIFELTRT